MKPFPPTLKEKRRYIYFEVNGGKFSEEDMRKAINRAVLGFLGEKGAADANFTVIELLAGKGVCRTTAQQLQNVMAALTLLNRAGDQKVAIIITAVSGTLKKARIKGKGI